MLSIGRLGANPDPAAYYVEVIASGAEDYYQSAEEAPGRWTGKGAEKIGLTGPVAAEDLRAVLDGEDPRSGEHLVGWRKRPGYDLTLSAPKSVSVLWGLSNRSTAEEVEQAHEDAVDAAISYLEDAACLVRRGRGGRIRIHGVGLVGASFRHRTSRAGDPNLHSHVVVANMTQAPDGEWSALFSRAVFRHARTAGAVYQAVLRHGLTERLGVGFGACQRGVREVEGVPPRVRKLFSQRRVEIEKAMAEHGARSKRGAQVATLDTRPAKPTGISAAAMRRGWHERAKEMGFNVKSVPRRTRPEAAAIPDGERGRLLTEHDATFDRRAVLRAVADGAIEGLAYPEIVAGADGFLASEDAVEVSPGRWSTPEMLAIEADALRLACAVGPVRPLPRRLASGAVTARPSMSTEQRRVVETITTAGEPVVMLIGQAGTGKTFALDAARAAWQAGGHEVIGAALAARAARQLQVGSGIPSSTITGLMADLGTGRVALGSQSVVVIDEAGMVGTRDLHRLIQATSRASAKLVLVGDNRQLAEIGAGGLFAALARRLGCAELTENRRQRDEAQRGIARALRDRKAERALLRLRRSGHLTVLDNADKLRDQMAADWLLEHRDGKQAVMLALHRSDVGDLNRRARSQLRANGDLGEPVIAIDDIELAVGDRVIALRNRRRIGLLNGTTATVEGRAGNDIVVITDEGARVQVPLDYLVDGHLTYAYALTIHKSQGMTCDVALVLGDDTLHAEAGYTAMTRARTRSHLYTVASADRGDALVELRRALERSTAKTTAHDHLTPTR